ncbi:hypothetical protein BGZ61DRAFT_437083 [Ilyonectria robusta]|uniref:uncharacterized protein n=1 Tax=Ilyonectria robusta TaxID=1079257 RepID=UPI001E8D8C20|nr:uncharacterized protein BGZ61DRAFT_437083 [Ilyonectria robusta]KAH8736811.1 hypothetical protein BGZ61DRAFT_437083 [Ilyonectria robusta]
MAPREGLACWLALVPGFPFRCAVSSPGGETRHQVIIRYRPSYNLPIRLASAVCTLERGLPGRPGQPYACLCALFSKKMPTD